MTPINDFAPRGANPSHSAAGQGGALPERPKPRPDKWTLLRAVEQARDPLGLKATPLNLLRAMLSFMRDDFISPHAEDSHICFASNAALAERAHVSVQTVERHIARLVGLGLVTRHAAGNNKRWARRDRQGRVVLASGLSLLPLLERHTELAERAEAYTRQKERLTLLRDRCVLALSHLKSILGEAKANAHELCQNAARILRRKPVEEQLTGLLDALKVEKSCIGEIGTGKSRGSDTSDEGHKETNINPSEEAPTLEDKQLSEREVTAAFPTLCLELRSAKNNADCKERMDLIASYLGLGQVWQTVNSMGPSLAFMILGYVLERQDRIQSPRRYAMRLVRDLQSGAMLPRDLLPTTAPKEPRSRSSMALA
ncbi:helix-turn-helix domain-containing protein [Sagittula sp.]